MESVLRQVLEPWGDFYVITGSSAAALTGLQFVVVTLIDAGFRDSDDPQDTSMTLGTFGTPTVVHFCAALLISTGLTAPWETPGRLRWAMFLLGAAGIVYGIVTALRARRTRSYKPVLEDWIFHVILPMVAYAGVFVAGALVESHVGEALFVAGAVTILLIFIGIHNAWDTVAYLAVQRVEQMRSRGSHGAGAAPQSPAAPPSAARGNRRRRR